MGFLSGKIFMNFTNQWPFVILLPLKYIFTKNHQNSTVGAPLLSILQLYYHHKLILQSLTSSRTIIEEGKAIEGTYEKFSADEKVGWLNMLLNRACSWVCDFADYARISLCYGWIRY